MILNGFNSLHGVYSYGIGIKKESENDVQSK